MKKEELDVDAHLGEPSVDLTLFLLSVYLDNIENMRPRVGSSRVVCDGYLEACG